MSTKIKMGETTVTGNLAADPREVTTADGSTFTAMRVLENRRTFNREQQQWVDGDTVGYDVAIQNDRLRQHALHSLSKGDRVTVRGNYEISSYVNTKTGEPGMNHRIGAREVSVSMFDDRFDPNIDIERDHVPVVESGREVDHELTAQGGGQIFYKRQDRTAPPPGPPPAGPTTSERELQEIALRQQNMTEQQRVLNQQQHNTFPTRPGAQGLSM